MTVLSTKLGFLPCILVCLNTIHCVGTMLETLELHSLTNRYIDCFCGIVWAIASHKTPVWNPPISLAMSLQLITLAFCTAAIMDSFPVFLTVFGILWSLANLLRV